MRKNALFGLQILILYAAGLQIQPNGDVNGGRLIIEACLTMNGDANIRICEGGTLVIEGGSIVNADITLVPGSTLIIRGGGSIHMASGKHFNAPPGVKVLIEEGDIN